MQRALLEPGNTISFKSKVFHRDCFRCFDCNKLLGTSCIDVQGSPYCDRCGRNAFIHSRLRNLESKGQYPPSSSSSSSDALPKSPSSRASHRSGTNPFSLSSKKESSPSPTNSSSPSSTSCSYCFNVLANDERFCRTCGKVRRTVSFSLSELFSDFFRSFTLTHYFDTGGAACSSLFGDNTIAAPN